MCKYRTLALAHTLRSADITVQSHTYTHAHTHLHRNVSAVDFAKYLFSIMFWVNMTNEKTVMTTSNDGNENCHKIILHVCMCILVLLHLFIKKLLVFGQTKAIHSLALFTYYCS